MINISNLRYSYRKQPALFEGLNLEIEYGRISGVFGLNGAGKSTLMKLIMGLKNPKSDCIRVNGQKPFDRKPQLLADSYYLPEELPETNETPLWYAKYVGTLYPKFDQSLLDRLMMEFSLDASKKISAMSYGQKKKFFIAFAISTGASLLILDEPTNGLDIPSKSQFRRVIASNMSDDKCILISTHQVKVLENLMDQVIILKDAKVVFNQSIEKIQEHYLFTDSQPHGEVLYKEAGLGASRYVSINDKETATKVDFELLFNGVISNPLNFNLATKTTW